MLDLVGPEAERLDARVLEPACGSGNFLVGVLRRKLASVESRFGRSAFEKQHYCVLAVMCTYGVELLEDNVTECRRNLFEIVSDFLAPTDATTAIAASSFVLSQNIIHGDAMTMLACTGDPIVLPEWGYLGKGRFQRRDFRLDTLAQMSSFGEDTLFADRGRHEVFTPVRSYPPLALGDLA